MKYLNVFLLILSYATAFSSCGYVEAEAGPAYHLVLEEQPKAAVGVLSGIEARIGAAFAQSIVGKDAAPLVALTNELVGIYEEKPISLVAYWLGYAYYHQAILAIQLKENDKSKEMIELAIKTVDDIERKNSEDYALLALAQSFSIQFKSGMRAGFASSKVKDNAERAMDLNPKNPRAQYVLASNDYYTPSKYGGGERAEEYLLKAIDLPDQEVPNDMLPSWGREQAFEMLLKIYIKKEMWETATDIYRRGIEAFPESYVINQLATKIIQRKQ